MADAAHPPEPRGEAKLPALTALLEQKFSGQVLAHHAQHGDETVVIARARMLDVFRFLRDDPACRMEFMIDLTAVDYLPRRPRFELVVHLKSLSLGHRLRVKVPVAEEQAEVDSITPLWVAAEWYERECWEMYGIAFKGHPDLRHLLLYDGFRGHPLRKDYEKGLAQPLVPLRPVRERWNYGERFMPVNPEQEDQAS
ncbi:MAG: NADH-quinone oxidoreductase subunit C [Candidatus Lambdaproteobacteria bacterium]|nr:NADH-quinone oxidoreductase subunit C [Candidatus Lambdaproteobacteria bacterium]